MSMSQAVPTPSAQAWFLDHLPEIKSRARACFSRLNSCEREEAVAEVVANVFKSSVSAARRGVLAKITPFHCVNYAAKQYRIGRRLAGYSSTDVMSKATWLRGRVSQVSLSSLDREGHDHHGGPPPTMAETLADRRADGDPFEETRRNLDYDTILEQERVSEKARAVFGMLSANRSTDNGLEMARALMVTSGRVSQLKTELAAALWRHEYRPGMAGAA